MILQHQVRKAARDSSADEPAAKKTKAAAAKTKGRGRGGRGCGKGNSKGLPDHGDDEPAPANADVGDQPRPPQDGNAVIAAPLAGDAVVAPPLAGNAVVAPIPAGNGVAAPRPAAAANARGGGGPPLTLDQRWALEA